MLVIEEFAIHEDEHCETKTTAAAAAPTKAKKMRAKRMTVDKMYMNNVPKEKLRNVV
jgi:hypothetical protein